MKENKSKRNISILSIILILIIIVLSYFAYAKYIAQINGSATAQIARFDFDLVNDIEERDEIANLATTRNDENLNVDEELIAPNTHGQFEIGINAINTNTSMVYEINIEVQNKPENLHFYSFYNETSGYNCQLDTIDGKIRLTGFFDCEQSNKQETKTIYWNWAYETGETPQEITENDILDSDYMGNISSINIVAKGTEVINPKVRTATGNIVDLTKENVATYYGEEVEYIGNGEDTNNPNTYRLFYVDFENKYGDGAGTIYLKADFNSIKGSMDEYSVDKTKIGQMNPLWKIKDNVINEYNEIYAAYLTDPSNWEKYVGNGASYAIGTPSIEMYLDSYNQSFSTDYKCSYMKYGYKYCTNGSDFNIRSEYGIISREKNGMYSYKTAGYNGNESFIWFASPSNWKNDSLLDVWISDSQRLDSNTCGAGWGYLCPVVSLKSSELIQLK